MAAKVSKVVMAMVTLPGIASGGRKRESQATITNRPAGTKGNDYLCYVIHSPIAGHINELFLFAF